MTEIEEFYDAMNQQKQKDKQVLEIAKGLLSPSAYKELLMVIEDSENTWGFKIEDSPVGKFQMEDEYPELIGIWVNQTTNGGMSGDEYAGTVSVKLKNNSYFKFFYSM